MRGMTRREREITDICKINNILSDSKVLHLGMCDGDEPYVVPMNYGFEFVGDKLIVYLHCARQGKKLDILKNNPKVFFEAECDTVPFDGDVACNYGMAYSCIMGKGTAKFCEDIEEKKHAMSVLMKTQTGKDFSFDDKLVSVVTVIKINVSQYTAKARPMPKNKCE